MPALPNPEAPPPAPDEHAPNPRVRPIHTPRRERTGPLVSATVRLYLTDPTADADEIVTAAVSIITTAYTASGDRILLASPATPATGSSRTRRDRLVDSVLRLGRGATTGPHSWRTDHHGPPGADSDSPPGSESESGLRPSPGDATEPGPHTSDRQPRSEPPGPGSDGFALIITGWSDHPVGPSAMTDWAPVLAPDGCFVVLTRSSGQGRVRADHSPLSWVVTRAGLVLTERVFLTPPLPSSPRTTARKTRTRQAVAFGGDRRIHTTVSVFRRSSLAPEDRRA